MKARAKLSYRFGTEFTDTRARKRFELTQPATEHRDVEYFKDWITDLRKRYPELAQYIVDTAELIVEASKMSP